MDFLLCYETNCTAPAEKYALTVKVKYCSVTQSCKLRNSEILHVPALLWPWLLKDWAYETYEAIVAQNQGTPNYNYNGTEKLYHSSF